jgi:hypothetical protein
VTYAGRIASARVSSGLTCYVHQFNDSTDQVARIVFEADNSIISNTLITLSAAARIFPIVIANEIYIIIHEVAASTVSLRKFTESTAVLSVVAASISITNAAIAIDVVSDGASFAVVSLDTSASDLRITKISTAGAILGTFTSATAGGLTPNADLINGEIYCYYQFGANKDCYMTVVNYAALTQTSAHQEIWVNSDANYVISQVVSGVQDNVVYAYIESYYNTSSKFIIETVQISATYVPSFANPNYENHSLAGKVATINGRIYIPICYGRNSTNDKGSTNFCLMNYSGQIIANANHGRVFTRDSQTSSLSLCGYPIIEGSKVTYPILTTFEEFSDANDLNSVVTIGSVSIDILIANTSKGCIYQGCLVVPGPIIKTYDGQLCSDYQFSSSLFANSATEDGAGNLEAGVRQWFVVCKYVDNQGNKHIGPPSNVISLNVGASRQSASLAFEMNTGLGH